jgi:beta-glucuronidase
VPGVFDAIPDPDAYGGAVKLYRLRFRAPDVAGYDWAFRFEQVRRRATVSLNGRRIGISIDPYNRFEVRARGLRPGRMNRLEVLVDSRKDPRLPEGWWNWGGIVRPVSLVPIGRVHLRDLGLMPAIRCDGPATRCGGGLLIDGMLDALPRDGSGERASIAIRLRSPSGRVTWRSYALRGSRSRQRRVRIQMGVPRPELWSPEDPQLYRARVALRYRGQTVQVERRRIGFRSVEVRDGRLLVNNRAVNLRGASIHEDFPGRGPALTGAAMDTVVRELEQLGANVTRAHYPLHPGLLARLDRAGIMVYSQAPVWQRDRNRKLGRKIDRDRALAQVERSVVAARSHPSVIVHSVANELAFAPDRRFDTPAFVRRAQRAARDLDPLIPIAIDLKNPTTGITRQETYAGFDVIGINQYYGWYPWVEDFAGLRPLLERMRGYYPDAALVMTEFGAEGRPDMADAAPDVKGGYAFQADHVARTIDVVDSLPFISGAIHWTLREFEIFPGWRGGAVPGEGPNGNTRHHKGVLTYHGARKPAWEVLRRSFARAPLYD